MLLFFGNRKDYVAGVPFSIGEAVTLHLTGTTSESFTLTIDEATAGGGFETLKKLTEKLAAEINGHSKIFRAYKIGEGGGYERLWITTTDDHAQPFTTQISYAGPAKIVSPIFGKSSSRSRISTAWRRAIRPGWSNPPGSMVRWRWSAICWSR